MRRLIALPLSKSFQMAFQSIRVRFFRSLVTTMSLVLAVAFLSFTKTGTTIAESFAASGNEQLVMAVSESGYDVQNTDESTGNTTKQQWIIFLSLLVCVVGIVNAQLMSVTERFREIGTLKCLGALDRFIVRIFIIEAAIQGLVGSLAGALTGAIVAIVAGLFQYGVLGADYLPWAGIFTTALLAIGTGILLSLAGALYPAVIAARMQPVEAMRVEQ